MPFHRSIQPCHCPKCQGAAAREWLAEREAELPRSGRKRGTQNQAIGRSKGGMTTKILALTDALGNLVRFVLLPGHRFDTVGVAPLIDGIAFGGLIADKAFDSNAIIANLNERGAKIVISQHPRRALPLRLDTGRRGRKCTQEVRARELKYAKECPLCGGSTRANAPSLGRGPAHIFAFS